MQLFYTPDISLPLYTLSEEESKHCVRVLRMERGTQLWLTDGQGNMYSAKVSDPNVKRCVVEITECTAQYGKRSYGLTMAVAPTKNMDRYEWFLEKATEMGVDRFVPLDCRHSERRTIKTEREEKVITSAVKQSLKAYHPQLDDMTSFRQLVCAPFDGVKLIAHCGEAIESRRLMREVVEPGQNVLILIGPEGDFAPEEVAQAVASGFVEITLGESRLRTETAAVAAVFNVAFINQ